MNAVAVLTFFVSISISMAAIPPIIRISLLKNLFDEPSEDRKVHQCRTPNLGGIAIFLGVIFSCCLVIPVGLIAHLNYLVASTLILFCLGLKDDLVGLSPLIKFIAQIIAALIVSVLAGFRVTSFYGFFGIGEISTPLSILISVLFILLVVNSFNLIDGINCLSGSLALVASLAFAYSFYLLKDFGMLYLCIGLIGSILGFLYFNRSPARIFMGDTGSLVIGFLVSLMAIRFIDLNRFNVETNPKPMFLSAPSMALGILIVPIFDTLRVFVLRIISGHSPFNADRNHIHHRLLDFGLGHMKSTAILTFISAFFVLIVFLLKDIGNIELIIFVGILAFSLNMVSWHFSKVIEKNSSLENEQVDNIIKLDKQVTYLNDISKNINVPLN